MVQSIQIFDIVNRLFVSDTPESKYKMLKPLFLSICIIISSYVQAQHVDTLSIEHSVDSFIEISGKCIRNRDFENAIKFIDVAEKVAIDNFGKNSISYGKCALIRGKMHFYKNEYMVAEKWYLEHNSILARVRGEDNMDFAWSLFVLGQLYNAMGQFEKAEQIYLKTKEIFGRIQGLHHTDYAIILNELAIMYRNMGSYEMAEPLYLESKSIREKVFGKNHPDYAWSLNNLANLYNLMGVFEKAEPFYLEALSIWEKLVGKENSTYASGMNNLASLYFHMRVYTKAEALFLEACTLRGKLLGKNTPDYAGSLSNLGSLYMEMGFYEKAEPCYQEAKAIREKIYGKDHPEYANTLGNIGILYNRMRNDKKAESYFIEAKSIWEKEVGIHHPEYATSLFNLGIFYLELDRLEIAEPLLLQANAIREKSLGIENPDVSESHRNLSKLFILQDRITEALPILEAVSGQNQNQLLKATNYLSEYELSQFIDTYQNQEDELGAYYYLCPLATNCLHAGKLAMLAYDRALFYKGFLRMAAVRLKTLSESTTESKNIYNQLRSYHRRLADEYSLPIEDRTLVAELEEKANAKEKELTIMLAGYSEANRQVKWKDVQKSIKKNEAAIEFMRFEINFPKVADSIMYCALILKENAAEPILISLFEEKSLDSLLQSKIERKADYVNGLYTIADRGAVQIQTSKQSLYELLWKPLEQHLQEIKTIYFSPSGLLHRINLDAIAVSETETLADRYKLIELNSTRQLVIPAPIIKVNNDALLYGGIQFEQDSSIQNMEPLLASRSRGEISFGTVDSTLRGGSWNFLSGTEREVNSIEQVLKNSGTQITTMKGYDATEESLKNIGTNDSPSPRILHIATHGYFFPDAKNKNESSSNEEPVFKMSDHPMLRSGLIMAGGNAAWKGKQTLEGREDGILTAYEISQMNLSNTELIVLSACETGLGDINGNEGVFGLQRAFKIAGAKYLIMSLWQVPDKQTSLLMTTFYKKWVEDKMSIPDAFHAAQKQLRDGGLEPYYWAGFVLVE